MKYKIFFNLKTHNHAKIQIMNLELRTRIWNNLVTSKFKFLYVGNLISIIQVWNKVILGFLTVTTLISVSLWVVWEKFPYVWAVIIASSQIMSALKPVFGYEKRIKYLVELSTKLNEVEFQFEQLLSKFDTSKLTDDEASEVFFSLHRQLGEITQPTESIVIRDKNRIKQNSQAALETYLKRNYNLNSTSK